MLTGRLTHDPEFMSTQSGVARCSFSVAVNRSYRDKVSGEWKEDTTYVSVVVWREAAQRCKEKLKKGSPVHVEGRLRSRKFENKASGAQRTVLEVEARRVQFLAAAETSAAGTTHRRLSVTGEPVTVRVRLMTKMASTTTAPM